MEKQMYSIFIYNGDAYRVDGIDLEIPGAFWAERLNAKFEGTEDYTSFFLDKLVKAQADSLVLALTDTNKH